MAILSEESVLESSPGRSARNYLKGIIIEPGLGLNSVAADMYRLLDGKRTIGDVATLIATDYDVAREQAVDDALRLASELIEEGAIRLVEPGGGE